MKKIFSLLFFFVFAVQLAVAERITESSAYDIASRFMNGSTQGIRKAKAGDSALRLVKSSTGYYAFNRGVASGFIIVASDDNVANTVLGYADEGTFPSAEEMPENMKWWLGEYDRQLAYAAAKGSVAAPYNITARKAITPLLKTLWGQDAPYSNYCPTVSGQNCPTGCVATALAQIMYYHKWPKQGVGSYSYDWRTGYNVTKLSVDFSKATYDWDSMTDTYNYKSTEAANEAVAQLMYHVGVASRMSYALDGSGTSSYYGALGLIRNFDYDKGLLVISRNYYGLAEWTDILYNELAAGRPFYYSGADNSNSGHAFVGDGYRDGYFHINWGWNGLSNGYFLVSALNPNMQGTGGGGDGYNYEQDVIVGIRPAVSGSSYKGLIYGQNFTTSSFAFSLGQQVTFSGPFFSYALASTSLYFAVKVVDEAGNVTYVNGNNQVTDMESYTGLSYFTVNTSTFPRTNGTYKVYPVFRLASSDEWQVINVMQPNANSYLLATVTDGSVKFTDPQAESVTLRADSLAAGTTPYAGNLFSVSAKLSCSGPEYYNYVCVAFKNLATGKTDIRTANRTLVDIVDGMKQEFKFSATAPSQAGDYQMVLQDNAGNDISDPVAVTVRSVPTGKLNLMVFKRLRVENADNVSADNFHFTSQLSCLSGFYSNILVAFVLDPATNSTVEYLTVPVIIGAGERQDIDVSGILTNVEEGKTYNLCLASVDASGAATQLSESVSGYNQASFTVKSLVSAVNAVKSAADTNIRIYSSTGILVASQHGAKPSLDNLTKGLYIVKQGNTTYKVMKR